MPWAVSIPQKQLILILARGKYRGFNDSHLAEKPRVEEDLSVSRETARRILRAAKLASPQKRRPRKYGSRRPPRPRFGMLALTDASRHDWLEGRGPEPTLTGFQDDATGQILAAHFQLEAENTLGYLRALHAMILTHGIPLSLYRDDTASSSATIPTGRWPNNSPENRLIPNSDALSTNSASSRSPPTRPRPRAASSAPGALARTVWSAKLRLAYATTLAQANVVLAHFCADYNPALRPSRRRCLFGLPLSAPPLRSRPLPELALSTPGRSRSHRHLRRPCRRPAAFAGPSWLCRRNRRTIPSARRHLARLSRGG